MPPRPLDAKPAARALAQYLVAERRRHFRPLTDDARAGFYSAALLHGCGTAEGWTTRGVKRPKSIAGQAGWLVFVLEGWAKPKAERKAA